MFYAASRVARIRASASQTQASGARLDRPWCAAVRRRARSRQAWRARPPALGLHDEALGKDLGPQPLLSVLPGERAAIAGVADDLDADAVGLLDGRRDDYSRRGAILHAGRSDRHGQQQAQSVGALLRMELKYRERAGETDVVRNSPAHRWHYFPRMEAQHALLLKTDDAETDGRARFMGHSAFEDPAGLPDAPKRESIEVRTMAFF